MAFADTTLEAGGSTNQSNFKALNADLDRWTNGA
jgi:hypothetical protein